MREKLYWFDSADWFSRPQLDVWPIRRSLLNLGWPKLEFGLSHEKLDVWPKPYLPIPSHSNAYHSLNKDTYTTLSFTSYNFLYWPWKNFSPLYFHLDLSFVNKFKYTFTGAHQHLMGSWPLSIFWHLLHWLLLLFFFFFNLFIYFWISSRCLAVMGDIDVDRFKHSHNKVFWKCNYIAINGIICSKKYLHLTVKHGH